MKQTFGTVAFLLTFVIQLPQAIKVVRTRETKDLSALSYLLIVLAGVSWVVYGLLNQEPVIWGANTVVGLLSLIILIYKLRFG